MSPATRLPVEVLTADWARVLRAAEASERVDAEDLEEEIGRRGAGLLAGEPPPERVDPLLAGEERLAALRRAFVRRAAALAVLRFEYASGRRRFVDAAEAEERAYVRKLALDRDVVPPMKEEARALRAEIRRLEAALRVAGVDPEAIGPAVDWSSTLAVDTYVRPEYESPESRRAKAIEFFRRLG